MSRFTRNSLILAVIGLALWIAGRVSDTTVSVDDGANIGGGIMKGLGLMMLLVGVLLAVRRFIRDRVRRSSQDLQK